MPSRHRAAMDAVMDLAFGRPPEHEKTAGAVTGLLKDPGARRIGRLLGTAGAGAIGGAHAFKENPTHGVLLGSAAGVLGGYGFRRLFGTRSSLKALEKATAKIKSPVEGQKLESAFLRAFKGDKLSTTDARLVAKHMTPHMTAQGAKYIAAGYAAGRVAPTVRRIAIQFQLPAPVVVEKLSAPRAEHWRNLKPGQTGSGPQGKRTQGRTWVDFDDGGAVKKEPGYLGQVARGVPVSVVKQLADIPKGGVEKKIEARLLGKKMPIRQAAGSGVARYIGGTAVGALTLPIFIKGVRLLKSDKKGDQQKGMALVLGSSIPYQAGKGGAEAFREAGKAGEKGGRRVLEALKGGGARAAVNLPAAVGVALGIAAARGKKKDEGGAGPLRTALYGAAGGGIGGALKGAAEVPVGKYVMKKKEFRDIKGARDLLRRAGARGAGRAAAGAAGGAFLGALFDLAAKAVKG